MTRRSRTLVSLALAAVVVVVAAVWLLGRRTLHVVNGLTTPVTVRLDGGEPRELAVGGHLELPVRAGARRVLVEAPGRAPETIDVDVTGGGVMSRPCFVVNPGGAATLVVEELAYGPPEPGHPPLPSEVWFGASSVTLEGIDFAFVPPPTTISTGDQRGVRRIAASIVPPRPSVVFGEYEEMASPARRVEWCLLRLGVDPADEEVLGALVTCAGDDEALRGRALAALEAGLARRPVEVAWHRAWQDLTRRGPGGSAAVLARAEELLRAAPGDAALLLLRARAEPRARAARAGYAAARDVDPEQAWAWHGLAFHALAVGDAAEAARCAAEAVKRRPKDADMAALHDDARLATLDPALARAVRADAEAALLRDPRSTNAAWRVLQALDVEQAPAEARTKFAKRFADEVLALDHDQDERGLGALVEGLRAALAGEAPALRVAAGRVAASSQRARLTLVAALLEGEGDEAAALAEGPLATSVEAALALAVQLRADAAASARWRARAAELFAASGKEVAAGLLRAEGPVDAGATPAGVDLAALDDAGTLDGALLAAALWSRTGDNALAERARRLGRAPTRLRAWLLQEMKGK